MFMSSESKDFGLLQLASKAYWTIGPVIEFKVFPFANDPGEIARVKKTKADPASPEASQDFAGRHRSPRNASESARTSRSKKRER